MILIALFLFVLFCRFLSKYYGKKRKNFGPLDQKDWHGPCLWWHGRANKNNLKPQIGRESGTTRA